MQGDLRRHGTRPRLARIRRHVRRRYKLSGWGAGAQAEAGGGVGAGAGYPPDGVALGGPGVPGFPGPGYAGHQPQAQPQAQPQPWQRPAVPAVAGPTTLAEACAYLAARPDALIVAGGTAVMADVNTGRVRPSALVSLHRCAELRGFAASAGAVTLHAGLTLTEMQRQELRAQVPALAQAARTIGSPHIRSAATLGGNLAVGPAMADLPVVLAALGAEILLASAASGIRAVPLFDFYDRDGRPLLAPGELVTGVRVPVVRGMQGFMKIGVRGGTARALVSTTLAVDPARRSATCVVGGMAVASAPGGTGRGGLPALLRADHADRWLADQVDWDAGAIPDPAVYETFGRLVAESVVYGDGAGTIGGVDPYRRRAAEICARRALLRALPPSGWLDQVRELQQRADFQRAKAKVEQAEREERAQRSGADEQRGGIG